MVEKAKADLGAQIIEVLCEYVSRVDAQLMLARSLRNAGVTGDHIDESNLSAVLARVQVNAALFVPNERRSALRDRLARLKDSGASRVGAPRPAAAPAPSTATETVEIRSENDIVVARTRARIMCEMITSKGVAAHKVATVVSELARNIVSYTEGGTIELTPATNPPSMTIRAVDRGTGIKNLDAIMNGSYRSKTGLGLGLSGSKRLATHFEIDTGPQGTTILVRMKL
jgi:serine/threonine-protein kinase RsbT